MSKSVSGFRAWPIVAVLGLGLLAYQAGSQQFSFGGSVVSAAPLLRVQYLGHPKDIVNLSEGTPYAVPAGKILIITDWCSSKAYSDNTISVDGVLVWAASYNQTTGGGVLKGSLRSGVRVNAGQTVDLISSSSSAMFASGYLANDT